MPRTLAVLITLILPLTASSQISRLGEDVTYRAELTGTLSDGHYKPFWFQHNRYGLGSVADNYGYLRARIGRDTEADAERNWRLGYGVDAVAALGLDNHVVLQQLYADIQWRMLRLSIGQKERPLELKNQLLSSGAMTTGINARPLPQLRLEMPDFWAVPGTRGWFAFKAHIAYGAYTDNGWQRQFNRGTDFKYTANSLYHTKELLLRVGNKERFPITVAGGLEMSSQFGGEAWNLQDRSDHAGAVPFDPHQKLPHDFNAFWHALIPGGNDVNDGDYDNAEGNQLGSWHLRIDGDWQKWGFAIYAEHFFDDHSQMFMQYPWRDALAGIELRLPRNPFLSTIVYEQMRTTHQSGPIYHDKSENMPEGLYGNDNYYNHQIYGAWQHAGFIMGHPLLLSPLYEDNGNIYVADNRIRAQHVGIAGEPHPDVRYRFLYTHQKTWGNYVTPRLNPAHGHYFLAEATYAPHRLKGFSATLAYGNNAGSLLGNSGGALLTIAYQGLINPKK